MANTSVARELTDNRSAADRPGPGRRQARERAIGLIYEAETKGEDPIATLEGLPAEPLPYATALVRGYAGNAERIDEIIAEHAKGWSLRRMPALDRAILRIGTQELLDANDVPTAVVLDEAVELAKTYSTDNSSRFINGVLAAIAPVLRTDSSPE